MAQRISSMLKHEKLIYSSLLLSIVFLVFIFVLPFHVASVRRSGKYFLVAKTNRKYQEELRMVMKVIILLVNLKLKPMVKLCRLKHSAQSISG